MKPATLFPHEINKLQENGKATLVRPVVPQHPVRGVRIPWKSPFGEIGDVFFATQRASTDNTKPLKERLFSRVYKFGSCWEWFGCCDTGNYGRISIDDTLFSVHRVSWELHNGPVPEEMHVLHTCDVTWCVNPDHLYLGTPADNGKDRKERGRAAGASGERSGSCKLNLKQVDEIRASRKDGVRVKRLSEIYGVTANHISKILHNRKWNSNPHQLPILGHRHIIHKGTTVVKRNGEWIFLTEVEVKVEKSQRS